MGSISRALQNAGYLRPVVDSLNELIQRRKYEQGLQQLAGMLSGSENRMRNIYESKAYNTMEPSRTESNIDVDAEENLQPLGLDKVQKSSPLAYLSSVKQPERTPLPITDDKPVAPRIDIGQPEYEVLGDIKEGSKYSPQEQNKLAGQEINSFLRRLITSQDIPMERGQVGLSALQQLANTYKPEKINLKGIDTTDDVYDDYGNLVKRGEPRETKESTPNRYERVETFDVNGKPVKRGLVKGTNTWEDLGEAYYKPNAGTTVNVNMPKESKWKDFGDLVAEAEATEFTDKEGNVVKKSSEEIQTAKNKLYKKGVGNLSPSALNWYNRKVKDAWKREDLSEADYYAELEQAIEEGELTNPEAIQSAMDFGSYRRYMFELDDKDYKAKK